MSNTRIWDSLSKTDPQQTKQFTRAGGFRGTATKPIWTELRMTEYFGPCGIGWGTEQPSFQLVEAGEEILVYTTVKLWYVEPGKDTRNYVYGIGGDKVMSATSSGKRTDDEAFKKSHTDAIGNAMKHIGVCADIHLGMFEDSKYVAEARNEFHPEDKQEAKQQQAEVLKAKLAAKTPTPISGYAEEFERKWAKVTTVAKAREVVTKLHSDLAEVAGGNHAAEFSANLQTRLGKSAGEMSLEELKQTAYMFWREIGKDYAANGNKPLWVVDDARAIRNGKQQEYPG